MFIFCICLGPKTVVFFFFFFLVSCHHRSKQMQAEQALPPLKNPLFNCGVIFLSLNSCKWKRKQMFPEKKLPLTSASYRSLALSGNHPLVI